MLKGVRRGNALDGFASVKVLDANNARLHDQSGTLNKFSECVLDSCPC